MVEKAYEVLSRGENEFKTVGANLAWKLQRMEENQRNIAEHLINSTPILHYGITKKLTDNVTINFNPPNRFSINAANNMYSQDSINNSQVQHSQPQLYTPITFLPPPRAIPNTVLYSATITLPARSTEPTTTTTLYSIILSATHSTTNRAIFGIYSFKIAINDATFKRK